MPKENARVACALICAQNTRDKILLCSLWTALFILIFTFCARSSWSGVADFDLCDLKNGVHGPGPFMAVVGNLYLVTQYTDNYSMIGGSDIGSTVHVFTAQQVLNINADASDLPSIGQARWAFTPGGPNEFIPEGLHQKNTIGKPYFYLLRKNSNNLWAIIALRKGATGLVFDGSDFISDDPNGFIPVGEKVPTALNCTPPPTPAPLPLCEDDTPSPTGLFSSAILATESSATEARRGSHDALVSGSSSQTDPLDTNQTFNSSVSANTSDTLTPTSPRNCRRRR